MNRRDFLSKTVVAGVAAVTTRLTNNPLVDAALGAQNKCVGNASVMPCREYGISGIKLSIIGFGGIVVMNTDQKHANKVVAKAVEKGINYFDVAPTYGDAELKLGPAIEPYRKKIFLACKTTQRKRAKSLEELKKSLKRLRTDYFDLYQLHAITDLRKDVDVAFGKGGAMETLIEAKKSGMVRHLGFAAHSVEAAMAAMDRYDFDSALFPVNFACFHSGNFGKQVIEKARKQNVSILALKALAKCRWPAESTDRKKFPKCWYQPLSDPKEAELSLRFTLSQPVTAAVPPGDESLFWLATEKAMNFKPLTKVEEQQVSQWAKNVTPLFKYEKK
jgi:aryl-alcohol dehydrogenase-like predicted oxidoreductase